jgi:four helix bundle protein
MLSKIKIMNLYDLEIYKLAREVSKESWSIYEQLNWQDKKIIGYQFISAVDSIGANIAEGFGRFHFLDKNKFSYNARGSLFESIHWIDLLLERNKISLEEGEKIKEKLNKLGVKINNYISSTRNQKLP